MARVTIDIDGKKIVHEITSKDHVKKFNEALKDPNRFKQFAADPGGFAKAYGVQIDAALASQIASKLKGKQSLSEVRAMGAGDGNGDNFVAGAVGIEAVTVADTMVGAVAV